MPIMKTIDQRVYEARLREEYIPEGVVATRMDENQEWCHGIERSLLHDQWLLRTTDKSKLVGRHDYIARFDAVVAEHGMRLNDPSLRNDLLSCKIASVKQISLPIKRRKMQAGKCVDWVNFYAWFVRWKLDRSTGSTAQLTIDDFDDFVKMISKRDVLDLVDYIPRAERLAQKIGRGEFKLLRPDKRGRDRLYWEDVATELGVSARSISRSTAFRQEFVDALASVRHVDGTPFATRMILSDDARNKGGTKGRKGSKDADAVAGEDRRGARTINGYLDLWDTISRMSASGQFDHDPLRFNPFEIHEKKKLQNQFGRERGRTENLLPPDFLRVMQAAAEWVFKYGDYIADAAEELREARLPNDRAARIRRAALTAAIDSRRPEGGPLLSMHWTAKPNAEGADADRVTVGKALKWLMASCAILLAGFGARRLSEFMSLKAGCVTNNNGVFQLSVYIEKTFQDMDEIPVPAMIDTIIKLMERVSLSTRLHTGDDFLFVILRDHELEERPYLRFDFSAEVNSFLLYIGLTPPSESGGWDLKSHQFRRGFSILYYHGFVLSRFDAIQLMLRHFDPSMSQIYIHDILSGNIGRLRQEIEARRERALKNISKEDKEWLQEAKRLLDELVKRQREFDAVRCEAIAHTLLTVWESQHADLTEEERLEERLSGPGAPRIMAELAEMEKRARMSIHLSSRANNPGALREPMLKKIMKWAATNFLDPVPGYSSLCNLTPGHEPHLRIAECLIRKRAHTTPWQAEIIQVNDTLPDHAFSGNFACLVCPLGVRAKEHRKVMRDQAASLDEAAELAVSNKAAESLKAKADRYKNKIYETDGVRLKK